MNEWMCEWMKSVWSYGPKILFLLPRWKSKSFVPSMSTFFKDNFGFHSLVWPQPSTQGQARSWIMHTVNQCMLSTCFISVWDRNLAWGLRGDGRRERVGFVVFLSQYEEWKEQRALNRIDYSLNHSCALSAPRCWAGDFTSLSLHFQVCKRVSNTCFLYGG